MVRIDETSITDARDNQLESHRFHFDVAKPEGWINELMLLPCSITG
jgi:hypothetical protein